MLTVKVLGPGCPNCTRVANLVTKAISNLGVDASVEKVTDVKDFLKHGILATPGLVIGEKLVCAGRVPSEAEITTWLVSELNQG